MRIKQVKALPDLTLKIEATDGSTGTFDISPYLNYEAFEALKDFSEFVKITNGGYFVEWECGADLSADTIEAKMTEFKESQSHRMC
jgi:hypothetical protein